MSEAKPSKRMILLMLAIVMLAATPMLLLKLKMGADARSARLLVEAIRRAVSKAGSTPAPVPLSSLTDFKWDEVVIVPPYADASSLSFDRQTCLVIRSHGIQYDDSLCVLVFKERGKAVAVLPVTRAVDFTTLSKSSYSVRDALFKPVISHGRIEMRD